MAPTVNRDEYVCKNKILFVNNSANYSDPHFNINGFLCRFKAYNPKKSIPVPYCNRGKILMHSTVF